MNRKSLQTLVAVNLVLLLALVFVTLAPTPAKAQFAGAQYIMVAGPTAGRAQQDVVYIIELQTARMIAMFYNSANDKIDVIAGVNLMDDIQAAGGR